MAMKLGNIEIFPHNFQVDFMGLRTVTAIISTILVIASIVFLAVKGLNYGIDFLGGVEMSITTQNQTGDSAYDRKEMSEIIKKSNLDSDSITVTKVETGEGAAGKTASFLIQIQRPKGGDVQQTTDSSAKLINHLKQEMGTDAITVDKVTNISGKIGEEEQIKAVVAVLVSLFAILIYIVFRFDLRFAPGAITCLAHDVIIALALSTLIGIPFSVSSIAAFLTIVGYSINDTIVIYDRIRETQMLSPRAEMTYVVNRSISQTLNRTVLTSITTLIALVILSTIGRGTVQDFSLTMLIGIAVGTYSSVYVASPLTIIMNDTLKRFGVELKDPALRATKAKKDPNFAPPVIVKHRPKKS